MIRICEVCKAKKHHCARGLCGACYQYHTTQGTLYAFHKRELFTVEERHRRRIAASDQRHRARSRAGLCPFCGSKEQTRGARCTSCKRKRIIKLRYTRSACDATTYLLLMKLQGRRCAICRRPQRAFIRGFAADHNHKTRKMRGLLCNNCNLLLGNALEKPSRLRAAIAYLERHS